MEQIDEELLELEMLLIQTEIEIASLKPQLEAWEETRECLLKEIKMRETDSYEDGITKKIYLSHHEA